MVKRFYWKLYFSQFQKMGCSADGFNLTLLPYYRRKGAGSVSWKVLFHLVFMIRGQIDWSPFVFKVARYSFLGSIPPKFEHKLRRQKQSFGKIATTVVLDEDENLLWSGLQRHRSCHGNEMMLLRILLTAAYLGTDNFSSKINHGSFFLQ